MAYAGDLKFNTKIDRSGFESDVNQLSGSTSKVMGRVKTALITGLAAIGTAIVSAGVMGVKYNAEMEQYFASFETMLGNADAAAKHMEDLKKMAAATPFEMSDLANASVTLQSFGIDVQDVEGSLQMLGDISLGNKEKFNGLALVFGQVKSQGKLMGQDLLQMINAGFNPLQVISEKTGESMTSLKDKMAKGAITFEMVEEAMRGATSEGGKFYNAMEKQSKTAIGQFSTLKDNINEKLGEAFKQLTDIITTKILPAVNKFVEGLDVKKIIKGFTTLLKIVAIIAPVIASIAVGAKISKGVIALTKAWKAATAALVAHQAANRLTLVTQLGGLSKMQMGVGILTGKVKLLTAAEAAKNAVMRMNPYILAATAIGVLIAAVVAYHIASDKTMTAEQRRVEKLKDLTKENREARDSYDDLKKSAEEQAATEIGQIEHTAFLKKELDNLVDSNGKVKEGYESRVNYILGELSEATGIELKMVDGEIQGYQDLSMAIDDVIEKKKAKVFLDANEESFTKATKNLEKEKTAIGNHNAQILELERQRQDALKRGNTAEAGALNDKIKMEKGLRDQAIKNVDKYTKDIQQYKDMELAFSSGNYAEVETLASGHYDRLSEIYEMDKAALGEKLKETVEYRNGLVEEYKRTGDETTLAMINQTNAEIDEMDLRYQSLTQSINNGSPGLSEAAKQTMLAAKLAGGAVDFSSIGVKIPQSIQEKINRGEPLTTGEMRRVMAAVKSAGMEQSFYGVGENVGSGIVSGMHSMLDRIANKAREMILAAKTAANDEAQSASPSKVFRDYVGAYLGLGVAVGMEDMIPRIKIAGKRMIDAAKPKTLGPSLAWDTGGMDIPFPAISKGTVIPAMVSAAAIIKTNVADTMDRVLDKLDAMEMRDIKQDIHFHEPVQTPADARDALAKLARIGLAVDK